MGEAAAGRTGVNRGAGFIVWGFVMGIVGTRTFGRVGNLSWKEKAVRTGVGRWWYGLRANRPQAVFVNKILLAQNHVHFCFVHGEVAELRNCNRLNSLQNLKNYHLYYIYYLHVIFTKKVCQSLQTTSATSLSLGWSALPWSFLCAKGIAGALQYFLILNIITPNTLLKKTGNCLKEQQVLFFIILIQPYSSGT